MCHNRVLRKDGAFADDVTPLSIAHYPLYDIDVLKAMETVDLGVAGEDNWSALSWTS